MPTSLFKDNFMRKSVKSQLAHVLEKGAQSSGENPQAMHVLDGGAIIHKVKWQKKVTYKDIAVQYVNYVRTRYRDCCIVFDGYGQGPTIKDHEHQRRIGKTCADIQLSENIKAHIDQQTFLSNEKNKSQFIALLSRCLEADGQILHNSTGDADALTVETSLQFARQEVKEVADDTDGPQERK
jgi:ribose 5-phosphate isomerase RpiB